MGGGGGGSGWRISDIKGSRSDGVCRIWQQNSWDSVELYDRLFHSSDAGCHIAHIYVPAFGNDSS